MKTINLSHKSGIKSILLLFLFFIPINAWAQRVINLNDENDFARLKVKSMSQIPQVFLDESTQVRTFVINPLLKKKSIVSEGDIINLQLFEDINYTAKVNTISTDSHGNLTLTLVIPDYPFAFGIITTDTDGTTSIIVSIPELGQNFSSRFNENTRENYLIEIDKSKVKFLESSNDAVPVPEILEKNSRSAPGKVPGADYGPSLGESPYVNATIDILVVYTPAAESAMITSRGSVSNFISNMIAVGNLCFSNSQTGITLRLAHSARVNYNETYPNNMGTTLRRLRDTDGYMDEVHTLRRQYNADLVQLITTESDAGGIGYMIVQEVENIGYRNAFSVVNVTQVKDSYPTSAHEIGHNMGLGHNLYQTSDWANPALFGYSYGWRWQGTYNNIYGNQFYSTVMTYGNGNFWQNGLTSERILYFSNPNLTHQGQPMGHVTYGDAARSLREVKHVVANYSNQLQDDNYNLQMYQSLSINNAADKKIQFGNEISINGQVINFGTKTFTGQIAAAIFDSKGNFVDFAQIRNYSLEPYYYSTSQFINKGGPPFIPGRYSVSLYYKTNEKDWTIVPANNGRTNYEEFEIYYSANIEVRSSFKITTDGGKLIQGKSATINVDVKNIGSSTFYGKFRVSLLDLAGNWLQDIQILNENEGLPSNYHYTYGLNFTGPITLSPGSYLMVVSYQPQGSSIWYKAEDNNYPNPINVEVESEIEPDIYEVNNTQSQAFNLPVSFSNNNAKIKTTGSNIHSENDIDFYKVVLPSGYDYSITARLHDSYNSGDGQSYTLDAKFSYSTDGTTYSETYNDIMQDELLVINGGTIYFKVAPYFENRIGSYLLTIDINRYKATNIEDVETNNQIIILPNPAKDFVTIELESFTEFINQIIMYDIQGKQVYRQTIDNYSRKENISLENLSNGVYFVQIYSTKGILTEKLIIKR